MSRKWIYRKPEALTDVHTHYCPGCGHGIAHKLVAEVIDELGIRERTIGIAPVGCSVLAYFYLNVDITEAAHGRSAAVATGIKRSLPDRIVFSYQGDGDLAAIGLAETIHAANRGENITVIFINNAVYGMTGGQMAPTSLLGQKTATSPQGRDARTMGDPIRMCELLNTLSPPFFIERVALDGPAGVRQARKAILDAFRAQVENKGYSFIEVLSACPPCHHVKPTAGLKHVEEVLMKEFPLGEFKNSERPSQ